MRKISLVVILLAIAGKGFCAQPAVSNRPREAVSNVIQTCADVQDWFGVSVPSAPPVAVVNGSTAPWKTVTVQNMSAFANNYFHYSVSMSTQGTGQAAATTGFKVPSGGSNFMTFSLLPGVSYYLMNDSTYTATTSVIGVCR